MSKVKSVLVMFSLVSGCGGPALLVNGRPTDAEAWRYDSSLVLQRAAFELHCNEDALKVTLVATMPAFPHPFPNAIGVEGCGHRAVYQSVPMTGWVLDSVANGDDVRVVGSGS